MVRCTQMFSFLLHLTYWREKKQHCDESDVTGRKPICPGPCRIVTFSPFAAQIYDPEKKNPGEAKVQRKQFHKETVSSFCSQNNKLI